MRQLRYELITVVFVAAIVLAGGCNDVLKNLAKTSGSAAKVVRAIQAAEISYHNDGKVGNEEHVAFQRGLIGVAIAGKDIDDALRGGSTSQGVIAKVNVALNALEKLNQDSVLRIKNQMARDNLTLLIESAKSTLSILKAALGG